MRFLRSLAEWAKIAFLTAGHEAFRDAFELFPAGANLAGLLGRDFFVLGGRRNDVQEFGEFLDDLVGGRHEKVRVRGVPGVADEKAPGMLANPLDETLIAGAFDEGLHPVKRVHGAAAGGMVRRFRPFVEH